MPYRPRFYCSRPIAALACAVALAVISSGAARAQEPARTLPVFVDGQAQVVPGFQDSTQWIRQELWVETGFDTDGDGKPDRVHVAVVRPGQTNTEGLKVPVVYKSSPYFSGTAASGMEYRWNVRQEVGAAATGYRSPLTYAQNLIGDLLMVHGTGDDNVHYQGTERVINKLIENNISFQMVAYPNRSHGIFEGEGTSRS